MQDLYYLHHLQQVAHDAYALPVALYFVKLLFYPFRTIVELFE